jgi:membrane protein implicated in regulation of membrane protease activity
MSTWVWLVVYLVGFALLQVLLYRYFQDSRGGQTAPRSSEPEGARAPVERATERDSDPRGGVSCPHCGTLNEAGYAYCRECAEQL